MSSKEVKIIISAVDNFSKAFNQLDDEITQLGKATEKISSAFDDFANASGSSKLQKMASTFADISSSLGTVQGRAGLAVRAVSEVVQAYVKLYDASKKNFVSNLELLGKVFGTIGSAVAGATSKVADFLSQLTGIDLSFTGLAQSSVKFGEELKRAYYTAGRGGDDLKNKMKGAAQEVSMQYGRSLNEVAQGMQEIASAGMDAEQVVELLGATTAVSLAGNLDMARSAEVLTNTMRAFKEEAFDEKTANRYANVLAAVSDKSATDIDQVGEALKNSANLAGQLNYSIEDVGTVIGLMGNQFIKGGRAGTALNNIMNRVASQNSNCVKTIKEHNLQAYEQKMLNKDLVGAMVELQNATAGLDEAEKAQIATGLAGTYGMQGLLAIMGQTSEETIRFQNSMKGANQATVLQSAIAATTSGKMSQLAATVGVVGEAIFSKFEPHVRTALDSAIEFARGLVVMGDEGYYVIRSLSDLADQSKQWGESLNQGIQKAINGIKEFVTGGALDNVLEIGTNIIQGICKGISTKAEDGTLKETFSAAIKKACKFVSDNSEALGKAGRDILDALAEAIRENEDVIKTALDDLMGIVTEWAKGGANLQSTMGLFADSMINAFVDQAIAKATGRGGEIWNALFSGVTLEDGANIKNGQGKGGLGSWLTENTSQGRGLKSFDEMVGNISKRAGDKLREGAKWVGDGIKSWFLGESYAAEVATNGGKQIGKTTGENVKIGFDEQGQPIVESATKTGTDAAAGIQAALQGMDLNYLQSLGQEMSNLGNLTAQTSEAMSLSFNNITNSARTSFTNFANIVRNQMLNVSNIIRNQMLNATNIVRNQATNMADAVRTGFVNMANIARNQFVNIANICRNQMLNCTNIVKNQTKNMNDATRTAFVNMANIVRNQMTNCTNIVRNQATNMTSALRSGMNGMASAAQAAMARVVAAVQSGMSQARAIASAPISINITSNIQRKVTTTHVAGGLMQTMDGISRGSITVPRPNTMASGGASINRIPSQQDKGYTFTIPVMVDGREIARATAKYSQSELDRLSKRNSRKRGE